MQAAIDATALAMAKLAPTLTQSQLQTQTTAYFNAMFNHPEANNIVLTPTYTTAGGSQPQVMEALAVEPLARHGIPKPPFYLTGQVGGQPFSVHAEGERVILTESAGQRREIDLTPPAPPAADFPAPVCPSAVMSSSSFEAGTEEPPAPGVAPLDQGLKDWRQQGRQGGEP